MAEKAGREEEEIEGVNEGGEECCVVLDKVLEEQEKGDLTCQHFKSIN